jgi:hypothetical protein
MDPMHLGLAFPAYGVLYQAILRKIYDFEGGLASSGFV